MPESDSADRAAITTLIANEDAAWNKGDAAAFSAHTLPGIVFTNIIGRFLVGRAPFEAQHAKIFSTVYKGSTLHQSIEHLVFIRSDVAIVDTITEVSGFHALPPGIQATDGKLRTRLQQVLVRNDAQWRVASFHNVPVNPEANAASPPSPRPH